MNLRKIDARYGSGGRLDADLHGCAYHLRGVKPPSEDELKDISLLKQVHGAEIITSPEGGERGDGMIMLRGGGAPGIVTADCLPVFLVTRHFTAAFHAGWKGTALGIAESMVRLLPEEPEFVLLGNCICAECYEVEEDVREKVIGKTPREDHPPGRVDLKKAVVNRMVSAGMSSTCPIWNLEECTRCNPGLFHSHRRSGTEKRNFQWLETEVS